VRVLFCGVRGSTPAPGPEYSRYGGHTSCVALAHDGRAAPSLVLDAGTGIRTVTTHLGGQPFRGTLLLTHLHWDHVQGLPFFAAADRDDAEVSLLMPEQQDGASAESVLARAMSPPHFPMTPSDLRGAWSFASLAPGDLSLHEFTVLAREIPHKGGRTFGYRVSDGRVTLTYMPDHRPTAFGDGPDGCGEYHPAALELARDTDLLIHDGQLLPDELAAEQRFGHASVEYVGRLAAHAGARAGVVFHHAPERTDNELDELAARIAREANVSVAMQDAVVEL
jgi:phosphoribosyl 1,2-cyclic phosphodiesterase